MALVHVHHFPLVAARHDDHIDTVPFQVIDKGNDARNACVVDALFKLIEMLLYFMPRFLFVFKIPIEYLSQRLPLYKMCKMRYAWFVHLAYPFAANGILRLGIQRHNIQIKKCRVIHFSPSFIG